MNIFNVAMMSALLAACGGKSNRYDRDSSSPDAQGGEQSMPATGGRASSGGMGGTSGTGGTSDAGTGSSIGGGNGNAGGEAGETGSAGQAGGSGGSDDDPTTTCTSTVQDVGPGTFEGLAASPDGFLLQWRNETGEVVKFWNRNGVPSEETRVVGSGDITATLLLGSEHGFLVGTTPPFPASPDIPTIIRFDTVGQYVGTGELWDDAEAKYGHLIAARMPFEDLLIWLENDSDIINGEPVPRSAYSYVWISDEGETGKTGQMYSEPAEASLLRSAATLNDRTIAFIKKTGWSEETGIDVEQISLFDTHFGLYRELTFTNPVRPSNEFRAWPLSLLSSTDAFVIHWLESRATEDGGWVGSSINMTYLTDEGAIGTTYELADGPLQLIPRNQNGFWGGIWNTPLGGGHTLEVVRLDEQGNRIFKSIVADDWNPDLNAGGVGFVRSGADRLAFAWTQEGRVRIAFLRCE